MVQINNVNVDIEIIREINDRYMERSEALDCIQSKPWL